MDGSGVACTKDELKLYQLFITVAVEVRKRLSSLVQGGCDIQSGPGNHAAGQPGAGQSGGLFPGMYEADIKGGRPSIAPEKLLRAMQKCFTTPSAGTAMPITCLRYTMKSSFP
jgi:hypothetical protein